MPLAFRASFAAIVAFLLLIMISGLQNVSAQTATAGEIIISEFRVRGPNGANDEFIELYNKSGTDHTVTAASGTGYGVAASDGGLRCSIPDGTTIPVNGHYLCVNSVGYSLASYPAGNGTTATGDATYTTDIPDNAGIALFNNNTGGASFSLANRLDAAGSTSEANTLYKEGTGYPALTPFSIDYSFYRKIVGTCTNTPNNCGLVSGSFPIEGNFTTVQDSDNNATDFVFVDTNGTSAGAGQRLGAPGPENLSSPVISDVYFSFNLVDSTVSRHSAPNRQRDGGAFCAPPNPVVPPCAPAQNSTFGTISFRRRFTNDTGADVTRLRFRVVDQTTFPAVSGVADLRNRTSSAVVIASVNDPATCAAKVPSESAPCSITVEGTTLETPPSQPNGSAYNSSMSADVITLATPLLPGASINVQFLLGIQQMGNYRFYVDIEALMAPVVPLKPTGDGARKQMRWASRSGITTGVTDATPVTSIKPGTSPGWVVAVPSRRGWTSPARVTASSSDREAEESSVNPISRQSRTTSATLELAAPFEKANPIANPSAKAPMIAATASTAAATTVLTAAAVSATSAAPAATSSKVQKIYSPKGRQNRRVNGRQVDETPRRKARRQR